MAYDTDKLGTGSSGAGPKLFSYDAGSDAIATVGGTGYFNDAYNQLTVGDVIQVAASDGNARAIVTAKASDVITIAIGSDEAGELNGSATYDAASLADGAGATTTVTVTGAALGDFAMASMGVDISGITLTAWVSAADTVSVRLQNESGGTLDLASTTLKARVVK